MRKLSIIYDVTALCPWNCAICCMGATTSKSCLAKELSQEQKLDIVRQVKELCNNGYDVRMDLSGGEIFTDIPNHTKLLKELSVVLGKDKVGVSCSGWGITPELAQFLAETVHDVEMTMDTVPGHLYKLRPSKYSAVAAKAAALLKAAGCTVGLQTVVGSYNNSYQDAKEVFDWMCDHKIDNWSILRFFASGRGANFPEAELTDTACEDYVCMVKALVEASTKQYKPEVDFHYLMPGHEKHTGECRCVRHSIGILPNGDVVACFWALDSSTGIVDPKFLLGNVKKNSLLEILNGEKAHYWSDCVHCCELSEKPEQKNKKEKEERHVLSA